MNGKSAHLSNIVMAEEQGCRKEGGLAMKVLVADDAAVMRMWLRQLLTEQGYEVLEARDGRETVTQYLAHRPAVVLLDITMPEIDGIEALGILRAHDPAARVVMVSASSQQQKIWTAIQAGAKEFIAKPFQPAHVLAAVARWANPER